MRELILRPFARNVPINGWTRYALVFAFAAAIAFFTVFAPAFATFSNIDSVLLNTVAPLAIVALAMTVVASLGAVDLSVGTAVDLASLVFVTLVARGVGLPIAVVAALGTALAVGLFNGVLIASFGVEPFLATLGTLFIGQSIQQLATDGGQPIYLLNQALPQAFSMLGHGRLLGVALPLYLVAALAFILHLLLARSRHGRGITVLGVQARVARYSGLPVRALLYLAFALSAVSSGFVGLILSSNVKAYVPLAGNGYLLNAIGATFIGATLSSSHRPNVPGTLVGVLLLGFAANGLLLIGWNFYWQQVAIGILIFIVLAVGTLSSPRR
ncbi:branched-chain amino acid ABC transporter permease [Caballeronia mineralivorans PML1(12)]|uniref:Branched-chain amino acid ABC transporter permease n=1 Tax=Caballeronia mineralivorans PML1(12) TaxID=908627 RepID=A0A0J1G308_9BURK|nr:ABC transporter permease [Caballeronia mineralivorans]KLU26568.1 branched-chain amino acid ABC transporter permease [Caballeronia mineralivorans PML1(12)]